MTAQDTRTELRDHEVQGVDDGTCVYCPGSDEFHGPGGDSDEEMAYCPYCGAEADSVSHNPMPEHDEVRCPATGMSTYRFCPNCGDRVCR